MTAVTTHPASPLPLPFAVPPRREVPDFPPIRRGSGGRHRLQQAVRHRPSVLAAGLLAAATALAAGPLRPGPHAPAAAATTAAEPASAPRCTGTAPPVD
ncbi:hypothetical protein [Kitasatospora sp. NPDC051914]|uniref:hypothetical protein n=1 Tax=Kitasatospora sp. NPDC051914 TaxID=3154945 RepID=UPI003419B6D2